MIVFETGDFKCGPFVLQPLSDREFASYPFHFFGNGLVQNPRVYFVVLMSVCPSIFTTDSIEILLASATVANVCLAIKWCYKINFELCKKEKVFKTEDLLWWSAWVMNQTLFLPQYQYFQKFWLCIRHALVLKNCLLLSGVCLPTSWVQMYALFLDYANRW